MDLSPNYITDNLEGKSEKTAKKNKYFKKMKKYKKAKKGQKVGNT